MLLKNIEPLSLKIRWVRGVVSSGILFVLASSICLKTWAQEPVVVIPLGDDTYQLTLDTPSLLSIHGTVNTTEYSEAYSVPIDAVFVLTKIVHGHPATCASDCNVAIGEDGTDKLIFREEALGTAVLDLGPGIPFGSGSGVEWKIDNGSGYLTVTLIGHLLSNE